VATDSLGNAYVCGARVPALSSLQFFAAKYSGGGALKWKNTLAGGGSSKFNFARAVIATGDGVYAVGIVARPRHGQDAALVRYKR